MHLSAYGLALVVWNHTHDNFETTVFNRNSTAQPHSSTVVLPCLLLSSCCHKCVAHQNPLAIRVVTAASEQPGSRKRKCDALRSDRTGSATRGIGARLQGRRRRRRSRWRARMSHAALSFYISRSIKRSRSVGDRRWRSC